MRRTVLLMLCLFAAFPVLAQPAPVHSFEVVSIRPSGKDSNYSFSYTPDGFRATNQTLWSLLSLAYLPMPLWSHDRIQNAPDWAEKQGYDIVAKVAVEDLPAWNGPDKRKEWMLLLQSMLADRFNLRLHTMPAEVPGFALVTASHGAKLKLADPNAILPKPAMNLSHGGVAVATRMGGPTDWTFYSAPIASLTDFLAIGAHSLIEDRTDLTGRYNFQLAVRDDADHIDHGELKDPASVWELNALGLRTVPARISTINLVIDRVEQPSQN